MCNVWLIIALCTFITCSGQEMSYRATAIAFSVRFPELIVNGPLYLNVVSLPPTFGCMWFGLEPSVVK